MEFYRPFQLLKPRHARQRRYDYGPHLLMVKLRHKCPSGFSAVARSNGAPGEMMWDHTHCSGNGNSVFCCPSNVAQPTCRWRGHKKSGKCDGACIAGETEVWNLKYGCKSGHQSACCSVTPSVAAYRDCRWEGDEPNCADESDGGHRKCSAQYPYRVVSARAGFGGENECQKVGLCHPHCPPIS
jgi:chitinase